MAFYGVDVSSLNDPHFTVAVQVATVPKRNVIKVDPIDPEEGDLTPSNRTNSSSAQNPTVIIKEVFIERGPDPRLPQHKLTILLGVTAFGTVAVWLCFVLIECCEEQASKRKVNQFETFNEIDVRRSIESEKREDSIEMHKVKQVGILSSHHSIGDDLNSREHVAIDSAIDPYDLDPETKKSLFLQS